MVRPTRSEEEWIKVYQERSAWWRHDDNPLRPHTKGTSGEHLAGFVRSALLFEDPLILQDIASDILYAFVQAGGRIEEVEAIVGPQRGGTKLAEAMARIVGNSCIWASPEKVWKGRDEVMVFSPEEFALLAGKSVLLSDDVLTTGGSFELTAQAVRKASGIVLPFVAVSVDRSNLEEK